MKGFLFRIQKCKLLGITFVVFQVSCGPTIQLIDVEVKLPATHPVHFENKEIAIFNALYDTVGQLGLVWNDSLLINKVAEGFRNQLAADLSIDPDSISVYNHFCGQNARGTIEDKEYLYSLSEQTGAYTLVLIDSLRRGDFERIQTKTSATSEYIPIFVSAEWEMVFRIFDVQSDQFIARFATKDTLVWNIIAKDRDRELIKTKLLLSIPETAQSLGEAMARITQPQWETQERVLFFFPSSSWFKAMDHAFMFEWEDAQTIWLEITKTKKNYKKIAYSAFNLAVASEMNGRIDLAKEWLDLASKYIKIPEIKYYQQMLDERKQQQRILIMQVE